MIQRIQAFFLLCAAIVTGLMLFMPVASIVAPDNFTYEFYTTKVVQAGSKPEFIAWNWSSLIANVLVILLPLITIFIPKKKTGSVKPVLFLQLRLCFVNSVFLVGLFALMWIQVRHISTETKAEWFSDISFVFPIIALIFTWLAIRNIIKDIALLKSLDRIR